MIADTGNSTMFKIAAIAKDGDLIDKPSCPPETNTTPKIYVSPTIAAAGPVPSYYVISSLGDQF